MNKKDYIIKTLELLQEDMPLARGLVILIKHTEISADFLDVLINAIQDSINKVDNMVLKQKLEKSNNIFKQLKLEEEKDRELDVLDIKKLDNMLDNI